MIGFTNAIPLEILLAGGQRPVYLKRNLAESKSPHVLQQEAELAGIPLHACDAIKGVYALTMRNGLAEILVTNDDRCHQARGVHELLLSQGVGCYCFTFPADRSRESLALEIKKLAYHYSAAAIDIDASHRLLNGIRAKLHEIDRLTWEENRVTGAENCRFLAAAIDMLGDPAGFSDRIDRFLAEARNRPPQSGRPRIGLVGNLPLNFDIFTQLEKLNVAVVFNELARQYAMPQLTDSLVDQYLSCTFPYGLERRLQDIELEVTQRRLDGLIHLREPGCERQVEDLLLRRHLNLPILSLTLNGTTQLQAPALEHLAGFTRMLQPPGTV